MLKGIRKWSGSGAWRLALVLAAAVAILPPAGARGHGAQPLRFGVPANPQLVLLSRVVTVYLQEGHGLPVEVRGGNTGEALRELFSARELDMVLALPAAEWTDVSCPAGTDSGADVTDAVAGRYGEEYPGARAELFRFALRGSPCRRPALVVRGAVAGELRYSTLATALQKVAGAVTSGDLERLLEEGGGRRSREQIAAARALLRNKGLL